MIMPSPRQSSSFLGQRADHSPVLVRACVVLRIAAVAASSVLLLASIAMAEPVAKSLPSAGASVADPFTAEIAEASRRFGVPTSWITAVMRAESLGDVRALSPKGAVGLMQIMPETYAGLRDRYGLGADPHAPRDNILAGAAFLGELHERYGSPGFLAAYNAGAARYDDHLATGRPLPVETQRYLALLAPMLGDDQDEGSVIVAGDPLAWTRGRLFVARCNIKSGDSTETPDLPRNHPKSGRPTVDVLALAPQSEGLFVRRPVGDLRR